MTFNKLSSLTRAAPVLSVLVVAAFLFAGPLAAVQQTAATTTLTPEESDIEETQDVATEELTESTRDVNGIEFTPRWGAISTLEPGSIEVLFADCREDEFAVSSQFVFETSDIITSQSFPIALSSDRMTWIGVVENTDSSEDRAASIGVICADENDGDGEDGDDIDIRIKNTINNVVNNFVRVENNQVTNLNTIINVRQQITNNAIQIAQITGNNNTVSQVIDQAASQIANVNATNPTEIQQIIDENAQQQGVIGGGTSLSQLIEQEAEQRANVTGGEGPTTVEQGIGQGAEQAANVTGGFGSTITDQVIEQGAGQEAQVDDTGDDEDE